MQPKLIYIIKKIKVTSFLQLKQVCAQTFYLFYNKISSKCKKKNAVFYA